MVELFLKFCRSWSFWGVGRETFGRGKMLVVFVVEISLETERGKDGFVLIGFLCSGLRGLEIRVR